MGDTLLAVNTLLMQLFTLFSYFCDGFALAGEALTGKAIGRKESTNRLVHQLFLWGWGITLPFTLVYLVGGSMLLSIFTDDTFVLTSALPYLPWSAAIPVCGFAAFLWDGIFVGATRTREMFLSLFFGAILFFALYEGGCRLLPAIAPGVSPNHLLWISFLLYLLLRGFVLWLFWHKRKGSY